MPILINAYCTHRQPPELEFPHELASRRDRNDPELPVHLNGFAGYVASRGEAMTQTRYHVIQHILRVQHHLSLSVEEDRLGAYEAWALSANALSFLPDGTVRDPWGAVLVYPGDVEPDEQARVPFPADAERRKQGAVERLTALSVEVPDGLPPVVSEVEVEPRLAIDVARRALALFAVALRAESLASNEPIPVQELRERSPHSFLALSPTEAAFLEADAPEHDQVLQMTWRYEALSLLEWALGLVDELPLPQQLCDVPNVAQRILDHAKPLASSPSLRPTSELLDALDLHYRLHWAVRQARIDGREPPAELEPGVILERHHALNWLVRFEGADWDDVDTPT